MYRFLPHLTAFYRFLPHFTVIYGFLPILTDCYRFGGTSSFYGRRRSGQEAAREQYRVGGRRGIEKGREGECDKMEMGKAMGVCQYFEKKMAQLCAD